MTAAAGWVAAKKASKKREKKINPSENARPKQNTTLP